MPGKLSIKTRLKQALEELARGIEPFSADALKHLRAALNESFRGEGERIHWMDRHILDFDVVRVEEPQLIFKDMAEELRTMRDEMRVKPTKSTWGSVSL